MQGLGAAGYGSRQQVLRNGDEVSSRSGLDLKVALDAAPTVRAAFDRLPFGLRRKHVNDIEAAKTAQTRERRIERLVESLR